MGELCRRLCFSLIIYFIFAGALVRLYSIHVPLPSAHNDVSDSYYRCVHHVRDYSGLGSLGSDDADGEEHVLHESSAHYEDSKSQSSRSRARASRVRHKYSGQGVRVVLIDTGLAKDFARYSVNEVRCISLVPHVSCHDAGYEHGTRSASVLGGNLEIPHARDAGQQRSRHRYVGMAPMAEMIILRVFDRTGLTRPEYVLRGLQMALTMKADVVSLSCGADVRSTHAHSPWGEHRAFIVDAIAALTARGAVVVAAAGNGGPAESTVHFPANLAEVITVGAMRHDCAHTESTVHAGHPVSGDARVVQGSTPHDDHRSVSYFSSRGVALPIASLLPRVGEDEYQRYAQGSAPKPNVLALGENVLAVQDVRHSNKPGASASSRHTNMPSHRTDSCDDSAAQSFHNHTSPNARLPDTELIIVTASGTSVAAPLVAGAVSLCIERLRRMPGEPINTASIALLLMRTASILTPPAASHVSPPRPPPAVSSFFSRLWRPMRGRRTTTSRLTSTSAGEPGEWNEADIFYNQAYYGVMAQGAGEVQPRRLMDHVDESGRTHTNEGKEEICMGHNCNDAPCTQYYRTRTSNINDALVKVTRHGVQGRECNHAAALPITYTFPPCIHAAGGWGATANSSLPCSSVWPYRQHSLIIGSPPRVFHFTTYVTNSATLERVGEPRLLVQRVCAVSRAAQTRDGRTTAQHERSSRTGAAQLCRGLVHGVDGIATLLPTAWVYHILDIRVAASPQVINYVGSIKMSVSAGYIAPDRAHSIRVSAVSAVNNYAAILIRGEVVLNYRKTMTGTTRKKNVSVGNDTVNMSYVTPVATVPITNVTEHRTDLVEATLCANCLHAHTDDNRGDSAIDCPSRCRVLPAITIRVPLLLAIEHSSTPAWSL